MYCRRHVLNQTDGLHDIGTLRWQTTLCLLLAWAVIFLCLAKGVKSSGKVRVTCSYKITNTIGSAILYECFGTITIT